LNSKKVFISLASSQQLHCSCK